MYILDSKPLFGGKRDAVLTSYLSAILSDEIVFNKADEYSWHLLGNGTYVLGALNTDLWLL